MCPNVMLGRSPSGTTSPKSTAAAEARAGIARGEQRLSATRTGDVVVVIILIHEELRGRGNCRGHASLTGSTGRGGGSHGGHG